MTEVVIEVGPGTIRGVNDIPLEWVSAVLDCIDDEFALLDDHPVSVADLWRDVMMTAAGGHVHVDIAVLVCPAWWPVARIDRVRQATRTAATEVVVLERIAVLREGFSAEATVVEIAEDIAVVSSWGRIAAVVPLQRDPVFDAEAVVAVIGSRAEVAVDAPAGLPGADMLASSIADRMRAVGVPVRIVGDLRVVRATTESRSPMDARSGRFRGQKVLAVLSGVLTVVALCAAFAATGERPARDIPMTLLVEGRVGVLVPATWTARRITSGPGSARVQVVSPVDGDVALHITQSSAPTASTLAATADSLRAALSDATDGAFVEFNPSDRREDREAVTYREVRPERHVAWTVLIDGTIRIAVGCQSMPGREDLIREVCDAAIRSAHAVG